MEDLKVYIADVCRALGNSIINEKTEGIIDKTLLEKKRYEKLCDYLPGIFPSHLLSDSSFTEPLLLLFHDPSKTFPRFLKIDKPVLNMKSREMGGRS